MDASTSSLSESDAERFRALTRPLPEPHLLLDVEGTLLAANRAAISALGLSATDAVPLADQVEVDRDELASVLRRALRSSEATIARLGFDGRRWTAHAGRATSALDQPCVLIRLQGDTLGMRRLDELNRQLASLGDEIRRRTALEARQLETIAELERLNREMVARSEELASFSYAVSHDLRGPLRAVTSFAEILDDDHASEMNPEAADAVKRIRAAAARMGLSMDALVELMQVVRWDLAAEPLDLTEMIEAEIDLATAGLDVERDVEPDLRLVGDRRLVRQLIAYLVDNAVKFARPGDPPRIRATQTTLDDQPAVRIADDGLGFDERYADRLFRPFEQLRQGTPGAGIGLVAARRICERHGGGIVAAGSLGAGAAFTFSLGPAPPSR